MNKTAHTRAGRAVSFYANYLKNSIITKTYAK
jgi:hypothetical protein